MYCEEKMIGGVLHWRTRPDSEFKPYSTKLLSGIIARLRDDIKRERNANRKLKQIREILRE